MNLLTVNDLSISFQTWDGQIKAVQNLSFNLQKGKALGIVGESGSGKTQTGHAIIGLLPSNARVSGSIQFKGQEITHLSEKKRNVLRSKEISIIFQDPMSALNPYLTIGRQLTEVLQCHSGKSRKAAQSEAIEMLEKVNIHNAAERMRQYPHEFSSGMRQRVAIAMALLCKPDLLIADEPTTALDTTVQTQILDLLKELMECFHMALLFISHDLGAVASMCEHILVMKKGKEVENGSRQQLFLQPQDPYTQNLLAAIPKLPPHTYGTEP